MRFGRSVSLKQKVQKSIKNASLIAICVGFPASPLSGFAMAQETSISLDSLAPSPNEEGNTTPQASSQEFTLEGVVTAKGSTLQIFDATVAESNNKDNNVRTDKSGKFEIKLKSQKIMIRADGYQDTEIQLENGQVPGGTISLEKSATLSEVGIIRARKKQEISQTTINRKELERIPGTGGDAVRALQSLPSVLPAGLGSSNVVVRGGAPGDNRYFFDRMELPFVFHFGGLGTVVPTRMLESVDLYPGGFSSQYGDATGGIIQMRSENSLPLKTSGQFELGLAQSSLYYEGKTDSDMGYRLGFRRTYWEIYKPVITKASKGNLGLFTVPQATDYQMILNGKTKNGTWQAYLLGASDKLSLAFPSQASDQGDGRAKFQVSNYFQTSGVRYNLNLGQGWGLTLAPQQAYIHINQQFFNNSIDIKSHVFAFDLNIDKRFSSKARASLLLRPQVERNIIAVDAIQFPAGGPDVFFDPDTAPRNKANYTDTTYPVLMGFDFIYTPVKSLTLNPSVSSLAGYGSNEQEFDPRISTRYEFMENQFAKAAWGYYSQRAEPQFTAKQYGNRNLKLERSIHNVLGWESKWSPQWETDLQFYYKDYFQLVGNATENPSNIYENNTIGRSKGVEILAKKSNVGSWFGWVSYSYSISEKQDPKTKKWKFSQYDRPHSMNLLASYRLSGRWQMGGKLQYLAGTPYTQITEGSFNQNTGRYRPKEGAVKEARLPSVVQVDVRSDYEFYWDTWTLDYYVEIFNVLNRKNVVGNRRSKDYSGEEKVYGSPIIPTMGVIASF